MTVAVRRWFADWLMRQQHLRRRRLRVTPLEDRRLPDAGFALAAGVLTLDGFDAGDSLSINFDSNINQYQFTLQSGVWDSSNLAGGPFEFVGDSRTLGVNTASLDGLIIDAATAPLSAVGDGASGFIAGALEIRGGGMVQLDSRNNDFDSVAITADSLTLVDSDDLTLSHLEIAGDATITLSGSLSDATDAAIHVTGTAFLTASQVELGNDAGDDIRFGALSFASDGAVDVAEADNMTLIGSNRSLDLQLRSQGRLADQNGTSILVTGTTELFADEIELGDHLSDTVDLDLLRFTASGSVSIHEHSSMLLLEGCSGDSVRLSSDSSIESGSNGSLTVITATDLELDAAGAVGSAGRFLLLDVDQLSTDSSGADGNQFLSIVGRTETDTISAGSGAVTFGSGEFSILNSISAAQLQLNAGVTLSGTGTIDAQLTAQTGAVVSPGPQPGTGRFQTGDLILGLGSSLNIGIDGNVPGTSYDQLAVTGLVTLGGTLNLDSSAGVTAAAGTTFTIIDNDGVDAVVGQFQGLSEGAILAVGGEVFVISYVGGDGNDVVLSADVPEYHFSQSTYTIAEGDDGAVVSSVVQLFRSGNTSIASDVQISIGALSGDTATPGTDFIAGTLTVHFAAGQTSASIPTGVVGDLTVEADETFSVSVINVSPVGSVTGSSSVTVVVQNDDSPLLVRVISGDLLITDETLSGSDSRVAVGFDAQTQEIVVTSAGGDLGTGGAVVSDEVRISAILVTGDIIFEGRGGDDVLTVDFSGGNPITGTGLICHGGSQNLSDGLAIVGSSGLTATYRPDPTTPGSGLIDVNGHEITFIGLEPVDISGMSQVIIQLPGADDLINVAAGTDYLSSGTNQALRVSGSSGGVLFESVALWDNALVSIDTTTVDGSDTVRMLNASNLHGNASLSVTTGSGLDQVQIDGPVLVTGSLQFQSAEIVVDSMFVVSGMQQTYQGAVLIDQSTSLIASDVTFEGTVDSVSGELNLLQISGGAVFEQSVGFTDRLRGISINGGNVEFRGTVNVADGGLSVVGDTITFRNVVRSISGGSVQITNSDILTIDTTADFFLDGGFLQDGVGSVRLGADVTTSGDSIRFSSSAMLTDGVTLQTTSTGFLNGADIRLQNVQGNANALTMDAGRSGEIRSGSMTDLSVLLVSDSGNTTIDGDLSASTVEIQNTGGTFTVTGSLNTMTLVTAMQPYAVALLGGGIVGSATVFLNQSGLTLGDSDDDVIQFTAGLRHVNATTAVRGTVATIGVDMTFADLTLSGSVRLTTGPAGGDITADHVAGSGVPVQLDAGTGSVDFSNAGNVFGDLIVTARHVVLAESDEITQAAAWNVSGTADLSASGTDILLTDPGNVFGTINASGRRILLYESGDMELDLISATGDVELMSGGSIVDANDGLLNVASAGGSVRLQAAADIGVAGDNVLTATFVDSIEVSASAVGIEAGGDAAVTLWRDAVCSELFGDSVFIETDSNLDLSTSVPAVRNLSLLALNGTVTLPTTLNVSGDLRLQADDVSAAGTIRLAAQRTIFESRQSESIELNALTRNALGLPGDQGSNSGQLDIRVGGDLRVNSVGTGLELADLNADGTSVDVGLRLFSLHAGGSVGQVVSTSGLQNSRIVAGQLELTGAADFDLRNTVNNVQVLSANIDGSLRYNDADALTIGSAGSTIGLTTTGDMHVVAVGSLRVEADVVAADGVEDVDGSTGETIRLESVDGSIVVDGTNASVRISTDENPVRSNVETGDRVLLRADSDQSLAGNTTTTAEGQITILGDVTISSDGGVARRFGPRPQPGQRDTAFFVFVSSPLPVVVDNAALGAGGGGAFLSAFAVEVGVTGEQNLQVDINWLDPIDETQYGSDPATRMAAAERGISLPVTSEQIQQLLISEGGEVNLVGHVYTILDYTLFQAVQGRRTIPVVFSVSHHSSLNLEGVIIEQFGVAESVPGRDLTSTDNRLTPAPQFENGTAEFSIPTFTPAPPRLFEPASVDRTETVEFISSPQERMMYDVPLVSDFESGAVSGSVFSTKVFLQIRRQFELDASPEIVIDRITDSRLISSREAFERFVQSNPELQDGSGYEIWLITETGGQKVERPIVEFEITGGRPGPAQEIQSDSPDGLKLQDVPFEQPAGPEEDPVPEGPRPLEQTDLRGAEAAEPHALNSQEIMGAFQLQSAPLPTRLDVGMSSQVSESATVESTVAAPATPESSAGEPSAVESQRAELVYEQLGHQDGESSSPALNHDGMLMMHSATAVLMKSAVRRFRRSGDRIEKVDSSRVNRIHTGRFRRHRTT